MTLTSSVRPDSLLQAPVVPRVQQYIVSTQTFHQIGNSTYENTTETQFEKTPLGVSPSEPLVRVRLQRFIQTNERGLNQLDSLLIPLKQELLIEPDAAGGLKRILNKAQLAKQFEELKPALLRKAKELPLLKPAIISNIGLLFAGEGYLEDILRASPEYSLLFPGLYGRAYSTEPIALGSRLLPRIFGNVDLPLLLTATSASTKPTDMAHGVYVTGSLDKENFRADDLRQALRAITDRFDLDTTLHVRHQESYEFDAAGELCYAARLSHYGVAGVFGTQQVCTLKPAIFT